MFLKRVNSDESSTSMKGDKDSVDTVSFNRGMLLSLNISLKPFVALYQEGELLERFLKTNLNLGRSNQTSIPKVFSIS